MKSRFSLGLSTLGTLALCASLTSACGQTESDDEAAAGQAPSAGEPAAGEPSGSHGEGSASSSGSPGEGSVYDSAADAGVAWGGEAAGGGGSPDWPGGEAYPNGAPGLEGAEIDDNADFAAFLEYYEAAWTSLGGASPDLHWIDLTARTMVTVRDADGRTVPDVDLQFFAPQSEGEALFAARSLADGRFALFPAVFDRQPESLTVVAHAGQARGEATLEAGAPALTITLDAAVDPGRPHLDLAFLIDCTGSMSEEIDRIKSTVETIAGRIAADPSAPILRLGLVAYRDRGDAFVTRTKDFTESVEDFGASLRPLTADGGGDTPEALNEALSDAFGRLSWRRETAVRLAFVIADAPAHFYEDAQYTYVDAMGDAAREGVKLLPISSGGADPFAEFQFRQLAVTTLGHFVFITEGGGSTAGSGGSDYDVPEEQLRVEALDDLVVRLVKTELDAYTRTPVETPEPAPAPEPVPVQ